ncbi:MAG TPA: thiolase family protein [Acidimicrobiales bacterium]|nr:thiolase family protein [Acidimicrobiales bacterium]
MPNAVIVDAVRTPGGRRNGALSGWHPADLASEVLRALITRTGIDPALVDDVITGCVTQVGRQSANIARYAVLGAGFPESVPATTVDRQCGSSQQAVHFAAQGVLAGAYDIAIAAGVEVMSTTPMGSATTADAFPIGEAVWGRYGDIETLGVKGLPHQGVGAEVLAQRWGLSREDLDAYGARSQQLATRARDEGRFERELVPVRERRIDPETGAPGEFGELVTADEGIRPDTTVESLARLKPAFYEDGRVTAGNASQISDGASAVLIMSEERANQLGLKPRARFHTFAVVGSDPVTMLTGPIPATTKVLDRAGLGIGDIDHFEVNEAFASVVLAWAKEVGPDLDRVNPNGGAIALGHPLGCSGTKLLATMLCELERSGGRYGLQTMCEGGGMANATIIERLD